MSLRHWSLLICLGALAACDAAGPARPAASRAPRPVTASATPVASPKPIAAPAVQATTVASVALTGSVVVDAPYLVATGQGILANDGASIISGGAGNIISNDGASILGQDGAGLVGAGILSSDGASIISGGAGNYGLLQAASGRSLPASGLVVQAVDLVTGRFVPMVDSRGRQGDAVLTDARGRYTVYVPTALAARVYLSARLPGATVDARGRYGILSALGSDITESSTQVVGFLRESLAGRFAAMMSPDLIDVTIRDEDYLPPALQDAMRDVAEKMRELSRKAGTPAMTPAVRAQLGQRMADSLLVKFEFEGVPIDTAASGWTGDPNEKALPALQAVLGELLAFAESKFKDPLQANFFVENPFIQKHNAYLATLGEPPFVIKKPSDLCDFIVRAYLVDSRPVRTYLKIGGIDAAAELLKAGGAPDGASTALHLRAGVNGIMAYGMLVFFQDPTPVYRVIEEAATVEGRARLEAAAQGL